MNETEWSGIGKWLGLTGGAIMFLVGIPLIFSGSEAQATAGWNIFLGLLIFGAIFSNNKSAPKILLAIGILNIVRAIISLAVTLAEPNSPLLFDFLLNSMVAAMLIYGGLGLRRQT